MKKLSILFLFLLLGITKTYSQSSISSAQSVFIYNFTRLIEWPAAYKSGDFTIGVVGSAELFNELKTYTTNKTVGTQPIKVVKFNSTAEITKCHILFAGYGKTKEIPDMVSKLGGTNTLIISENKGGIEKGATVNFVIIEDKLKFELKTSNASGLKIHSTLENMAIAKY